MRGIARFRWASGRPRLAAERVRQSAADIAAPPLGHAGHGAEKCPERSDDCNLGVYPSRIWTSSHRQRRDVMRLRKPPSREVTTIARCNRRGSAKSVEALSFSGNLDTCQLCFFQLGKNRARLKKSPALVWHSLDRRGDLLHPRVRSPRSCEILMHFAPVYLTHAYSL